MICRMCSNSEADSVGTECGYIYKYGSISIVSYCASE